MMPRWLRLRCTCLSQPSGAGGEGHQVQPGLSRLTVSTTTLAHRSGEKQEGAVHNTRGIGVRKDVARMDDVVDADGYHLNPPGPGARDEGQAEEQGPTTTERGTTSRNKKSTKDIKVSSHNT